MPQLEEVLDVTCKPSDATRAFGARLRLVAILPRGETWRNFVYTGVLQRVSEERDVTVVSVRPKNDALWQGMQERFDDLRELKPIRERWLASIQHELLDVAHGRWLWSEAAQERWRLRDLEAVTFADKCKRLGKKAITAAFSNAAGLRLLERTGDWSSRVLRTTDHYLDLYRELRPSLVFNASHVHCRVAVPAVQAARWLKIPTATFLFSWDNLTSQGRIIPFYDYYLVWNEAIREQLHSLYPSVRRDRVFVTGTPQFDAHFQPEHYWSREEFCRRIGADPARPLVLYTTGMANHMPDEPEIVRGIADMLRGMDAGATPQLMLRVYPKDRTDRFDALLRDRPDILNCPAPWERDWLTPLEADTAWLTNTLRHADVGINVASTVSLELCMFDKPVLNVGYNPPGVPTSELEYARYYSFDHYRPIVESGAVEVADSPDHMRRLLASAFQRPQARSEVRHNLLRAFFGNTLDGESSARVVQTLAALTLAKPGRNYIA
jgi:hypothetical protein